MMDRRNFLKSLAAAGILSGLEGEALVRASENKKNRAYRPIERRALGSTGEKLSMIGFGGIVVMRQTPQEAASYVAEAFERGINYFDVAPMYGDAQARLGPALKPYRGRCFLACKTDKRGAAEAEAELHDSLKLLQTDHLDLYQFHAITTVKEVEKVFAPKGAMETFLKARETGKVRFLGFSAHSEQAAHAAMDRFDFDTILFPFNFATWHKSKFGPAIFKRARQKKMGVLALKPMAHQRWPAKGRPAGAKWTKCWYEPLDQAEQVTLALRFTLGLPVDAALPPGHWDLFKMAAEIAASGAIKPLSGKEKKALERLAEAANPIFPIHA